jgi:hypothetical protein
MKTCIIMGNGPSLNQMFPHGLAENTPTFGVNYCPFQPTYYVCVDHDILVSHHEKIYEWVAGAKTAYLAEKEAGSSNLYDLPNVELITHDRDAFHLEHYFSGLTVVYVALKIAYYLGFEEVHLWGVDHNKEWDHYREDYPRGDVDRRLWRMSEMEYHYSLAQRVYNKAGRVIVNHSHPSKLDAIFPRVGKE